MKKNLVPRRVFVNPVFKDRAVVLKTKQETGGLYTLGQLEVSPGGGNYLHVHAAFAETFTAVEGILGVRIKNRKYYLKPGESMTVPVNTPHHFFNDSSEKITCLVQFNPGHDDFVKGLAIGYGLATDGRTNSKGIPRSLTHLALLIVLTDTKPLGWMGLMFPFFKFLAARARRNGTEKKLLEQYYYE